ncbi:hypothetical protein [Demequina salsinemoris]|uniref:hypothetical protein n=1 Tax=Demequina salsinemoris TaxID=577470 RepID=UPI0007816C8D|nr:hypothetical protein [Demequina salsinemoris]
MSDARERPSGLRWPAPTRAFRDRRATSSLVYGLVSAGCVGLSAAVSFGAGGLMFGLALGSAVMGIVQGHRALYGIKRGRPTNRAVAVVGLILSYLLLAASLYVVVMFAAFMLRIVFAPAR